MSEITLTASQNQRGCGCGGCGCGAADIPVLDARELPSAIRPGAVLGAVGSLQADASLILVASHDPAPLLAQIRQQYGESIEADYLVQAPGEVRVRITRR